MSPKKPATRRPAPHPDDFPLGSPESRAAARTLAEEQARMVAPSADRTIHVVSHIPGLAGSTGTFIQPNGTTVSIAIEAAPHPDAPHAAPKESAAPHPVEMPQQNE